MRTIIVLIILLNLSVLGIAQNQQYPTGDIAPTKEQLEAAPKFKAPISNADGISRILPRFDLSDIDNFKLTIKEQPSGENSCQSYAISYGIDILNSIGSTTRNNSSPRFVYDSLRNDELAENERQKNCSNWCDLYSNICSMPFPLITAFEKAKEGIPTADKYRGSLCGKKFLSYLSRYSRTANYQRELMSWNPITFNYENSTPPKSIEDSIQDIKERIYQRQPVLISIASITFQNERAELKEISSEMILVGTGWHAMTIVGYDNDKSINGEKGAFKIANSWGEGVHDKGFIWIT